MQSIKFEREVEILIAKRASYKNKVYIKYILLIEQQQVVH